MEAILIMQNPSRVLCAMVPWFPYQTVLHVEKPTQEVVLDVAKR